MTAAENLLAELIALPSVNPAFLPAGDERGGEGRVAECLASKATSAGLSVEFQQVLPDRSNLIVRLIPRGKPTRRVILAPHLDTVGSVNMPESHFKPAVENGRMHGRGACDTKGSVAAMFTAVLEAAFSPPRETEIIFAGLVDEENAQKGSRVLAKSRLKADLAIIGEPTEARVVTAHKGDMWLKLITHGKAAHGARPELGRNAVHQMARVIDLLETKYAKFLRRRKHPLLGSATINVGSVRGGTQPNIVPDRCEIEIDRRTVPDEIDSRVRREILGFIRDAGLAVEMENAKHHPCIGLETDPKVPLVAQFMSLARQRESIGVDFFCDAAIISAGGTPSVVFGPGNIAQAHTVDEWISLKSLKRATLLLTRFLRGLP
ncbi:MAG TPA: M20/M25/M40 family metallo-hydrolase [Verrucomicrobiae bacterium]|jgi:acetylornithine deacetylase/succinyl-diaminopimelate desuccinylase-like protein|nr:M20/M25/M40 family metallo-hydrolase [Verrucomicrobiae bacterium]